MRIDVRRLIHNMRRSPAREVEAVVSGEAARCLQRGAELVRDIAAGRPLVGDEVFGIKGYPHCAPHMTQEQWDLIWSAWCDQLSRETEARLAAQSW